jgi:hypothetical protein
VALDPESRLVVSVVVAKRTTAATHALVQDFHRRTGGRVMRLVTSDEYPVYADALRATYGQVVTPPRTGRPGRPRQAYIEVPPEVREQLDIVLVDTIEEALEHALERAA